MFGVELRVVDDDRKVLPRDGNSSGRLQMRGAACSSATSRRTQDCVDEDNWFDTGDVAVIHPDGTMQITDRAKDVIKSGGEWISSIELENAAVGCPGVAEAAAIGIPHPEMGRAAAAADRPRRRQQCRARPKSAITWRTRSPNGGSRTRSSSSTTCRTPPPASFSKKDLRDQYRDYRFANAEAMVGRD